jgi:hypothetical protein
MSELLDRLFSVAGERQGTVGRLTPLVGGLLVLQLTIRLVLFQHNAEEGHLNLVYYGNLAACISSGSLFFWVLVRILRQREEIWRFYEASRRVVQSAARQQVEVWRHCGHFLSAALDSLRSAASSWIHRCCRRSSKRGASTSPYNAGETGGDQHPVLVQRHGRPVSATVEPVVAHQMDRIEPPSTTSFSDSKQA